jgi:hypothetical protein
LLTALAGLFVALAMLLVLAALLLGWILALCLTRILVLLARFVRFLWAVLALLLLVLFTLGSLRLSGHDAPPEIKKSPLGETRILKSPYPRLCISRAKSICKHGVS